MSSKGMVVWQQAFGGLPPVGYALRAGIRDRWQRLYSLPGGKRYSTNDDETSEVIRRHNMVACVALGLGVPVTAWVAHYGNKPPGLDLQYWKWVSEPPLWLGSEADLESLEGARFLERTLEWTPNALDDEFRLRADDKLATLTIFSDVLGSAFCPYDGGMDVFVRSQALVASLRQLFPDWLSTHPTGL